jgi:hypothetical protein
MKLATVAASLSINGAGFVGFLGGLPWPTLVASAFGTVLLLAVDRHYQDRESCRDHEVEKAVVERYGRLEGGAAKDVLAGLTEMRKARRPPSRRKKNRGTTG